MHRRIIALTLLCSFAAGCAQISESRFNPLNWFGASRAEATSGETQALAPLVRPGQQTMVIDQRSLVANITALRVDRTPYGALVHATGTTPTQGYYNAELVPTGIENGTLTLAFRAQAPAGFEATGAARTRQITAAYELSVAELAGIRRIRVQGAQNSRTSSR